MTKKHWISRIWKTQCNNSSIALFKVYKKYIEFYYVAEIILQVHKKLKTEWEDIHLILDSFFKNQTVIKLEKQLALENWKPGWLLQWVDFSIFDCQRVVENIWKYFPKKN